jgi:hypothetical protein
MFQQALFKDVAASLILVTAAAISTAVMAADADPTLNQVYEAAQNGHLVQAQQMMQQVLRDHPRSAKAHYVTAELDAKAGDLGAARQELSTAEALDPGLGFAKPESVRALRSELSRSTRGSYAPNSYAPGGYAAPAAARATSIPWIPILLVLGVIAVIWMIVSRRRAMAYGYGPGYPAGGSLPGPGGGLPPNMGGPGYPAGYGAAGYGGDPVAGGGGSGLLGSLASGAALGAGVVAGEELVRHVLEPGRGEGLAARPEEYENRPVEPAPNDNMGGNDFGVQSDSGWDDNSGGSGGDFGGGGDGGGEWS